MINHNLHRNFKNVSYEYFKVGLENFHRSRNYNKSLAQVSMGNLSISIELMLKACIALKCPRYLFSNLPLEIELKLSYPDNFPNLNIMQKREIENFGFKSQSFTDSIAIFYLLFQKEKKKLRPYFSVLNYIRNTAVHSASDNFQRIDLERLAYLSIYLSKFLKTETVFEPYSFRITNKDNEFYASYDENRTERVKKIIEIAKQNAKKIKEKNFIVTDETWETRITECPTCKSDAILEGYCDFYYDKTYDGADAFLTFIGESFNCDECKLELFDQTELTLAGIEKDFDISDEIPEYLQENEYLLDQYGIDT